MNKWKKKYYTFRVNGIVKRLAKKANKKHVDTGKKYAVPLARMRVPDFLSESDRKTWLLARKAQWMLKHNAPNENDITGLDFDPKKDENTLFPFEKTNAEKDKNINYDVPDPYEPGILVTFADKDGGPVDMNNPAGAITLYNGKKEHPVYGARKDVQEKIQSENEHLGRDKETGKE